MSGIPASLRRPALPPSRAPSPPTTMTVRMTRESAAAIAAVAEQENITMKQVMFRALSAAGVPVAKVDLDDRTPKRSRLL